MIPSARRKRPTFDSRTIRSCALCSSSARATRPVRRSSARTPYWVFEEDGDDEEEGLEKGEAEGS